MSPDAEVWSFPGGMLGTEDSVKGFRVEAADGHAGKVSWASYAPGESYLVVSHLHHLHEVHHVVPAGAVERISTEERGVWLSPVPRRGRRLARAPRPARTGGLVDGRCGRARNRYSQSRRGHALTCPSVRECHPTGAFLAATAEAEADGRTVTARTEDQWETA